MPGWACKGGTVNLANEFDGVSQRVLLKELADGFLILTPDIWVVRLDVFLNHFHLLGGEEGA